jgi:hypothetical protein
MSYKGVGTDLTFKAKTDLSAAQFRIVEISGAFQVDAPALNGGLGVLQTEPRTGEHAAVRIFGETKVQAGSGGITAGNFFKAAASGYATHVQSTFTAQKVIGQAITTAASGMLFSALLTGVWAIGSGDLI